MRCPVARPVASSQFSRILLSQAVFRRAALVTDSQFLCFSLPLLAEEAPR
jgi:hypothetical protein